MANMFRNYLAGAFLLSAVSALAAGPSTINYQGRLTDPSGAPLTGDYSVTFGLYDTPLGGSPYWTSSTNVTASDGLFSLILGESPMTPLTPSLFDSPALWLGVQVEGDPELTPRVKLTSVPYSHTTQSVNNAAGGQITSDLSVAGSIDAFSSPTGSSSYYGVTSQVHGGIGSNYAGYFSAMNTFKTWGIYAEASSNTECYGLFAKASMTPSGGAAAEAIRGEAVVATSGVNYGVTAFASGGSSNYGVYAVGGSSGSGYAGYFAGDLRTTGTLSKSAGSFRIDHPLDPANKYLQHSFVESPDMMNIYNGNVVTDALGHATIVLPEYFESLNIEFRYQLTVIGTFAQAIVQEKVRDNKFTISTDKPYVEVSWQVTGIRNDPYAARHRIEVEVPKQGVEAGTLLHPELHNQSPDRALASKLPMPSQSGPKRTGGQKN